METIQFPYRSTSHLPLLLVIDESGAWENNGLNVEFNYYIEGDVSHRKAGREVEFIGGTHISPYFKRVDGDPWIYVGQTVTDMDPYLISAPDSGITEVGDLRGKRIGTRGRHPHLNEWLFLKKHGLEEDNGDYEFVELDERDRIEAITDGVADAGIVEPPDDIFAERAGLDAYDVGMMPMVRGTTISTIKPYVEENHDTVINLLKGTMEGIAYFQNNRQDSIDIIQERYTEDGDLDDEIAARIYDTFNKCVAPTLYPSPESIHNVYVESVRQNSKAEQVEPFELWDFSFLREIMDSGFADDL